MLLAMLLVAVNLAGCSSTIEQPKDLVYQPIPSDYAQRITTNLHETLFDPYSMQDLEIGEPVKFWSRDGLIYGLKMHYGWRVPVRLNAKNRLGAYTGIQTVYYFFADDFMVEWDEHADIVHQQQLGDRGFVK